MFVKFPLDFNVTKYITSGIINHKVFIPKKSYILVIVVFRL